MWSFEGHGLEFMPLDVRRKLDLAGVRPSLAEWQALRLEDRARLDAAPAEGFADLVLSLLPEAKRVPPSRGEWNTAAARDAIAARASSLGARLESWEERWEKLDDAARYALHRLADPKKDAEKFRAALSELAK